MVYVALMRGINVGGKNKVDMKLLKKQLTEAGLESVVTYINSGNVIFTDDSRSKPELARVVEQVILDAFQVDIKVLVLDMADMEAVMAVLPDEWKNDEQMKCDVLFLWEQMDQETLAAQLPVKPGVDTVRYAPGAVLWAVERQQVTKSKLTKLVGTALYRKMTVRNANTARKIYELMQAQSKLTAI